MKRDVLSQAVKDILFHEWDPIGVNDSPRAGNEYDSYAPTLCRLIRERADDHKIVRHLERLQKLSMGLSTTNPAHDLRIASRLISLMKSTKNS
jgi:hypothetical protein